MDILRNPIGKHTHKKTILIIQIEATIIKMYRLSMKKGSLLEPTFLKSWDPTQFLSDRKGIRLLEEIARHAQPIYTEEDIDFIALTLPGTIEGTSTIDGSSRLGIYDTVDATTECKKLGMPSTYVFHDAECLAAGEVLLNDFYLNKDLEHELDSFVYIVVDEGVGSSIFFGGQPYHGAGVAGHIGRLVMNPWGTFNPTFNSRGTLEVYAARPWVSHNVVNEYLAEKDKTGALSANSSPFRAAVAAAADSGKTKLLTLQQLADGVKDKDTLILPVLEDAAQNLGIAINAIMTILNPPLIVLGGGMIAEIPGFSDKVIDYARRNSFAGIWNETKVITARKAEDTQAKGTAYLLSRFLNEDL